MNLGQLLFMTSSLGDNLQEVYGEVSNHQQARIVGYVVLLMVILLIVWYIYRYYHKKKYQDSEPSPISTISKCQERCESEKMHEDVGQSHKEEEPLQTQEEKYMPKAPVVIDDSVSIPTTDAILPERSENIPQDQDPTVVGGPVVESSPNIAAKTLYVEYDIPQDFVQPFDSWNYPVCKFPEKGVFCGLIEEDFFPVEVLQKSLLNGYCKNI